MRTAINSQRFGDISIGRKAHSDIAPTKRIMTLEAAQSAIAGTSNVVIAFVNLSIISLPSRSRPIVSNPFRKNAITLTNAIVPNRDFGSGD